MNEELLKERLEDALTKKGKLHKELIKAKRSAEASTGQSADELFTLAMDIEIADARVMKARHGILTIKKEFAESEDELED